MNIRVLVLTCSDTASRDPQTDRSGPLAVELITADGITDVQAHVVADDLDQIARVISRAVATGVRVVVCTGGTGLGPRDVTPQAIASLGAVAVPGIGELLRATARDQIPMTDLSRAGAWTLHQALIVALPGSPGGVRDGWQVVAPLVPHAVQMLAGGGHGTRDAPEASTPPAKSVPREVSEAPWVSATPIDVAAVTATVARPDAGAVVTFEGRVRDHDHGRQVTALTYEGHPGADTILREVVAEALSRPGVLAAAARHRVGDLAIGDLAYFVSVCAAHRSEAFDAGAWLVDTAKERLPIWKHQTFADGTSEWVNCP